MYLREKQKIKFEVYKWVTSDYNEVNKKVTNLE